MRGRESLLNEKEEFTTEHTESTEKGQGLIFCFLFLCELCVLCGELSGPYCRPDQE